MFIDDSYKHRCSRIFHQTLEFFVVSSSKRLYYYHEYGIFFCIYTGSFRVIRKMGMVVLNVGLRYRRSRPRWLEAIEKKIFYSSYDFFTSVRHFYHSYTLCMRHKNPLSLCLCLSLSLFSTSTVPILSEFRFYLSKASRHFNVTHSTTLKWKKL